APDIGVPLVGERAGAAAPQRRREVFLDPGPCLATETFDIAHGNSPKGYVATDRVSASLLRPVLRRASLVFPVQNWVKRKKKSYEEPPLRNRPKLSLRVPQPKHRPGDKPDFSALQISEAGEVRRPEIDAPPRDIVDLAFSLIRVLDKNGKAMGPWNPKLDAETLRRGLKTMLLTRAFDDRMFRAQRQGKTSFYMKSTGEEAVPVAQAFALDRNDMCFPSYRQQGLLIARGYPLVDMMNQIYSNAQDPVKGRQLPIMYSTKEYGFFSISGNLGTQFPQAVGWAMASAYKGDDRIAAGWIGDGT